MKPSPKKRSQVSDRSHVMNRDRSQSSENRYGRNSRSRYVDKITWNQMNEDFGPGGLFPKNDPPVNRFARNHPPVKTQTVNAEPGSFRILQRNEPVLFEAKSTGEPSVVGTGNLTKPQNVGKMWSWRATLLGHSRYWSEYQFNRPPYDVPCRKSRKPASAPFVRPDRKCDAHRWENDSWSYVWKA